MVAPSVATDHFAQFPAGDSGGSGDIDYRCFFGEKEKLVPCVCVKGFWFSVMLGLCMHVMLLFVSAAIFPHVGLP